MRIRSACLYIHTQNKMLYCRCSLSINLKLDWIQLLLCLHEYYNGFGACTHPSRSQNWFCKFSNFICKIYANRCCNMCTAVYGGECLRRQIRIWRFFFFFFYYTNRNHLYSCKMTFLLNLWPLVFCWDVFCCCNLREIDEKLFLGHFLFERSYLLRNYKKILISYYFKNFWHRIWNRNNLLEKHIYA